MWVLVEESAEPISSLEEHNDLLDSGDGDEAADALSLLPRGVLAVDAAVTALRRYSLINRPIDGMVSVHRLVQFATLDQLNPNQRAAWRHVATTLLRAVLPGGAEEPDSWHQLAAWTGETGDARAARDQGDAATARDQYGALLPVRERVLGAAHPTTLTTRYGLARWAGEAGDAAAARDQLAAILPIEERVLGADHPNALVTRHELARWTGETGDAAAARDQYAALLPTVERVQGAEHPATVAARQSLNHWREQAERRTGLFGVIRARIRGSK